MAGGVVFIGRVFKFSSDETDLFPHYRKSFCMTASEVNDCSLNYVLVEASDLGSMTLPNCLDRMKNETA